MCSFVSLKRDRERELKTIVRRKSEVHKKSKRSWFGILSMGTLNSGVSYAMLTRPDKDETAVIGF